MNLLSKSSNHSVYIVANQFEINHRLKGIISLKDSFEKVLLIARNGPQIEDKHLMIRPYYNPLGLLRLIGFHQTKKNIERYLFFPSIQILYVRPAIKRLRRVIAHDLEKGKKISLITSLPPHDLAMIGLALKSDFPDIHWIVDWQDLWSWDEYYFAKVPKFYRSKILNLEKKILKKCNVNVTTNIKAKAVLEKHYKIPSERIIAINHHFYRPDLPDNLPDPQFHYNCKNDSKIKIGFLGNLFKPPKVPGSKVVEAIRELRKSDFNIELHIFGDNSLLARKATFSAQNNSVVLHSPTNHKQSLLNIMQCQFLLLALSDSPNSHVVMHSKLPHYLLLKRPIIAIVPRNSFVADLIIETGSGYVIASESSWVRKLAKIIQNYSQTKYISQRNEEEIEKYSWECISKSWLQVIKSSPHVNST
jgi:glycosyltransferase involved in cell wall biosynthesis